MKIKTLLAASAVAATFFVPVTAHADENLLSGDTRLACEAILCLSSGDRPSECAPALSRYFGIRLDKPHETIQARLNFLNLCPVSREPNMPQLTHALANGAGRCDAAELNRVMRATYQVRICSEQTRAGRRNTESCHVETRTYVRNAKPSYCTAYHDHQWTTAGDKVRFIGTEKQGGRWVDVK